MGTSLDKACRTLRRNAEQYVRTVSTLVVTEELMGTGQKQGQGVMHDIHALALALQLGVQCRRKKEAWTTALVP